MIGKALLMGVVAWPLLLGVSAWRRAEGAAWPGMAYFAASIVCHQRPARSFHSAGVQWPVCARCSGLYMSAPLGGLAAMLAGARWRADRRAVVVLLATAALPTAATLLLEWTGVPMTNALRFLAALPLGAAVAAVLIRTAAAPRLD